MFFHLAGKIWAGVHRTIKYPTDEVEPCWDVFDAVEELANPEFDIPFDADAVFSGNRDDLFEFNGEMWSRPA
jgi:hypothetical protein